jgi:hypothetical protein
MVPANALKFMVAGSTARGLGLSTWQAVRPGEGRYFAVSNGERKQV